MTKQLLTLFLGATALTAGPGASAMTQEAAPSGSASAQPMPDRPHRGGGLLRADANGDGIVTRDEVIADADRRFAAIDTDHDGKLSREEMRAARDARGGDGAVAGGQMPPTSSARPDRRGPDRPSLTREAFRERALRMFDRADTNHDGRVDAQEREAARLMMRARMANGGGRGAAPTDEQR